MYCSTFSASRRGAWLTTLAALAINEPAALFTTVDQIVVLTVRWSIGADTLVATRQLLRYCSYCVLYEAVLLFNSRLSEHGCIECRLRNTLPATTSDAYKACAVRDPSHVHVLVQQAAVIALTSLHTQRRGVGPLERPEYERCRGLYRGASWPIPSTFLTSAQAIQTWNSAFFKSCLDRERTVELLHTVLCFLYRTVDMQCHC